MGRTLGDGKPQRSGAALFSYVTLEGTCTSSNISFFPPPRRFPPLLSGRDLVPRAAHCRMEMGQTGALSLFPWIKSCLAQGADLSLEKQTCLGPVPSTVTSW